MKKLISLCVASMVTAIGLASDFNDIVNRIVKSDPTLQTERLQSTANLLEMGTANNLENPEISFEALFGQFGDNKYDIELSQTFDWPGVYSARRTQMNAARRFSDATFRVSAADKRQQAAELILNLINSRRKLENYKRVSSQFKSLLETYESQYQKGNVSILDLNKLRIEVANLDILYADEYINMTDLTSSLTTICNNDPGAVEETKNLTDFPLMPINDLDDYLDAIERSPEIEAARAQNELNLHGITVTKREGMPGFSLGYRFSREEGQTFHGLTFAMSIPSWGNRGKKAAAEAAAATSEFAMRALSNNLENSIRQTYNSASFLRDRISYYGKALHASDNLSLLDRAFTAGQIDLTSYIQDVRYFVDAENSYGDLQCRFLSALVMLSRYK